MIFSPQEFELRLSRARKLMEQEKLDAIIVTGDFSAGMNYYYLSGHLPRDYQSNFSRPHIMVLKQDGQARSWTGLFRTSSRSERRYPDLSPAVVGGLHSEAFS